MLFLDRRDAGRRLVGRLLAFRGPDIVVAGLAGGGVPVAVQIADALRVDLDIMVVQELPSPGQSETFGVIAERGVRLVDRDVVSQLAAGAAELTRIERAERDALRRRTDRFRELLPRPGLAGRTVVIVDESLPHAARARAACRAAYAYGAIRAVFAAPVGVPRAVAGLSGDADKVVCPHLCEHGDEIAACYQDFGPVGDDEVCALLRSAAGPQLVSATPRGKSVGDHVEFGLLASGQ